MQPRRLPKGRAERRQTGSVLWSRPQTRYSLRPDGTVNEISMSDDNMVSFNHYAFGSVGRFLYQHVLGIQAAEPGFARVRFAPIASRELGSTSGSYLSRSGLICSAWRVDGDVVTYEIETPVEAEITLADGSTHAVSAGQHTFTCGAENLPVIESLDYDAMIPEPEAPATSAVESQKPASGVLNASSTIGKILADAGGKAIIDELIPGLSANEQLKAAYGMTFPRIAGMMHLPEQLVQQLIARLNRLSEK